MDCAGNQFLADAAFAGDKHGCAGGRYLPNHLKHVLHRSAFTDDMLECFIRLHLFDKFTVLQYQFAVLESAFYQQGKSVKVERLG